jgi:hypothetical protein
MDYEHLSDEEIGRLIKQMVPELEIGEITDDNRQTVIAFLKLLVGLNPTAG